MAYEVYTGNVDVGTPTLVDSKTIYADDLQGTLAFIPSLPSGASVDNLFYFSINGNYYRRIVDGPFRAAWAGIKGDGTDQTSKLTTLFGNALVKEVVFDFPGETVITINGTVDAGHRKLRFIQGNMLTGTGEINNCIIDAGFRQQIFKLPTTPSSPRLTVNPSGVTHEMFSAMWFGASPAANGADNAYRIQVAIDTVIRNSQLIHTLFIPAGQYLLSAPLIVHNWYYNAGPPVEALYKAATIRIKGETTYWDSTFGTRFLPQFKDRFCLGIQCGKGVTVEGIRFYGQFQVPTATKYDWYKLSLEEFIANDPSCRNDQHSPYGAIIIDPFSNGQTYNPPPPLPPVLQYPSTDAYGVSLSTYYRGNMSSGGSTATVIQDCRFEKFIVGIASSVNNFTRNAEMTIITKCEFTFIAICIASSQDQEKSIEVSHIGAWSEIHTFYTNKYYGPQIPGMVNIHNVCIAGRVNTFADIESGGYFPSSMSNIFTESLGRFGTMTSAGNCMIVSNSELGFAVPEDDPLKGGDTNAYADYHFNVLGTKFDNCKIRYYNNKGWPIVVKGTATFDNCHFDVVPFIGWSTDQEYWANSLGSTVFRDCTCQGGLLGPTTAKRGGISGYNNPSGRWTLERPDNYPVKNVSYEFEDEPPYIVVRDTCTVISINSNRQFTIQSTAAQIHKYDKGKLVLYKPGGHFRPAGLVTDVDTGTNIVSLSFAAIGFNPSVNDIIEFHVHIPLYDNGAFMGDVSSSAADKYKITNCRIDYNIPNNDFNKLVGQWIRSRNHTVDTYIPYVKITKFTSPDILEVSSVANYTQEAMWFSGAKRKLITLTGVSSLNGMQDSEILPEGSIIKGQVYDGVRNIKWLVTKTGYVKAPSGDLRQARYKMIEPAVGKMYQLVSANYTIQFDDEVIDVNTNGGNISLYLKEAKRYTTGFNGLREVTVRNLGTNSVTINKCASPDQPIDGQNTIVLSTQYSSVTLIIAFARGASDTYVVGTKH